MAINYSKEVAKLLPPGPAWSDEDAFIQGVEAECERLDKQIQSLLSNAIPSSVLTLLTQWEKDWGLPDDCFSTLTNVSNRRTMLTAKIKHLFIPSRKTFKLLLAEFGYYRCEIIQNDVFRVGGRVNERVSNLEVVFSYTIRLNSGDIPDDPLFRTNNSSLIGDRLYAQQWLRYITPTAVNCVLKKYFPINLNFFMEA